MQSVKKPGVIINIASMDTPLRIQEKINAAIESGEYYVQNGEWPVLARNVFKWIDDNYKQPHLSNADNISDIEYTISKGDRLFQICSPSLEPIQMNIVSELSNFQILDCDFLFIDCHAILHYII